MTVDTPRVACLVTAYFPRSHADVMVTRLLTGDYSQPRPAHPRLYRAEVAARELAEAPLPHDAGGQPLAPRLRVASLYLDQTPPNDIGREWAARAGVPVFPTIREALTLGGNKLVVDGVLIIGEHGDYPLSEWGQKMYPRRRFFEETVAVFRESGRVVPVFNDKHFSHSWEDTRWMYDTARQMGIPLMAGSQATSVPLSWRRPPLELPLGVEIHGALSIGFGHVEHYGFHSLEVLQCMVERRTGGETGVAAVQCLSGQAAWQAATAGNWDTTLLEAGLEKLANKIEGDPRQLAPEPDVFLLEYRDGLRAAVCMLNGVARERGFAARVTLPGRAAPETVATRWVHHSMEPFGHHAYVLERIQDLILTGRAQRPVERTLLTSGILARVMESRGRGGVRLETPELAICYDPAGQA